MIQACLDILYFHFPADSDCEKLADRANQLVMSVQEKLRDFVILHYCLNQRTGQDFWDSCRQMSLPASLQDRIDEYRQTANLILDEQDFFKMNSWVSLFSGFDLLPDYLHPKLREFSEQSIAKELQTMASSIQQLIPRLPSQDHFLNLCASANAVRPKQAAQG
jgi:tryptophan 7-halogenase